MTASNNDLKPTSKNSPQSILLGTGSKKISNEPLFGFVPRIVNAKQVQGVLVRDDPQVVGGKITDKSTGWGRESIQQAAVFPPIQEDSRSQEKTSGLCPNV